MQAEQENLLYTDALYAGTGLEKRDYLAIVDVGPCEPANRKLHKVVSGDDIKARTGRGIPGQVHHPKGTVLNKRRSQEGCPFL